jgi:hypothetical protein
MTDNMRKVRQRVGWVLLALAFALLVPLGLVQVSRGAEPLSWGISLFEQFLIGVCSIAFALIAIDPILNASQLRMDEEREKQRLKDDLLSRLRSRIDGVAAQASEQLQRHGWVRDGTLKQAHLAGANLKQVVLHGANLQEADLEEAHLFQADLRYTNLEEASIDKVDLRGADLTGANVRYASLQDTDLEGSFLDGADLRGAYLVGANLKGVSLAGAKLDWSVHSDDYRLAPPAKFDEETLLPDGTNWTPETDMRRFTDPSYSGFWHAQSVQESH